MSVLIIDDQAKQQIAEVMAYAHLHVYTMDDLLDLKNGQLPPAGDDPNHVVHLKIGHRVVYSIEEQNLGKCHHFSFSFHNPKKLPPPETVEMILQAFGVNTPLMRCEHVAMEDTPNGGTIIHVITQIKKPGE